MSLFNFFLQKNKNYNFIMISNAKNDRRIYIEKIINNDKLLIYMTLNTSQRKSPCIKWSKLLHG